MRQGVSGEWAQGPLLAEAGGVPEAEAGDEAVPLFGVGGTL